MDAKLASDWDVEDELVRSIGLSRPSPRPDGWLSSFSMPPGNNPLAETMKRQRPNLAPGLSSVRVETGNLNVLIAYAAKEGSATVEVEGDHSPYTAALLHNLFVPGLDVRLAFGRVRDEVLKATDSRRTGRLRRAGRRVFALVPGPAASAAPVGEFRGSTDRLSLDREDQHQGIGRSS